MDNWIIEQLNSTEDYPNPQYAFNSTVNWMHALRTLSENITDEALSEFYSKKMTVNTNKEYTNKSIASIYSSLTYLRSLSSLSAYDDKSLNSINAHLAIVAWYYCIYNSCKAMIACFNSSYQENHTATAKAFHELSKQGLLMPPFNYRICNLTKSSVTSAINDYSKDYNGKTLASDYYPTSETSCLNSTLAYLKGTADYYTRQTEEQIKKDQGYENFRTKKAQQARDQSLTKKKVNFLHQAFRYRGKANYRDCIYFIANAEDRRLEDFIADLEYVAHKFFAMSAFYVSKKVDNAIWTNFISSYEMDVTSYFSAEKGQK